MGNRNIELEKLFEAETGEEAISYDMEYDYEFYVPNYTNWLENKVEELIMVILRSGSLS